MDTQRVSLERSIYRVQQDIKALRLDIETLEDRLNKLVETSEALDKTIELRNQEVICGFCGESIKREAKICKFCKQAQAKFTHVVAQMEGKIKRAISEALAKNQKELNTSQLIVQDANSAKTDSVFNPKLLATIINESISNFQNEAKSK